MRLLIRFSENTSYISTINQHLIDSYIYHKCLKDDKEIHNAKNDYCISHLYGGKLNKNNNTINFPNGAFILVTSQKEEFLNKIILGVLNNVDFIGGMKFKTFEFISEEFINGWNYFATLSPFIVKEYISKKEYIFFVFNDKAFLNKASENVKQKIKVMEEKEFSEILTNHTKNKLGKIYSSIDLKDFKVEVKTHPSHKIKTIFQQYDHENKKSVVNYANQCHVNIFCSKEIAEIIYNLGIGQSTGSGFGTIYKTENHKLYKTF
jgi:CRISPR/Cas system endoribonuclease Cas6 (RAMP superfamily)